MFLLLLRFPLWAFVFLSAPSSPNPSSHLSFSSLCLGHFRLFFLWSHKSLSGEKWNGEDAAKRNRGREGWQHLWERRDLHDKLTISFSSKKKWWERKGWQKRRQEACSRGGRTQPFPLRSSRQRASLSSLSRATLFPPKRGLAF